ncbi:MAG TPA: decarboxylase [Candidatus Binatia bacterium]|jgi:sulfopyruvate decarboxylase TPP-binding subunit
MPEYPLTAEAIKQQFKRAGVHFVVALPDRVTSHYLLKGLLSDPDFHVVQVCKEDEGVSICSGLYAAGHKSVLMMQYTGFLDSINAIRGVGVEGRFPVCMIVGLLGKEPDVAPTKSKKYGVKIIEPILDVMGIEHHLIERDADAEQIGPVIDKTFSNSFPSAILIGREPR